MPRWKPKYNPWYPFYKYRSTSRPTVNDAYEMIEYDCPPWLKYRGCSNVFRAFRDIAKNEYRDYDAADYADKMALRCCRIADAKKEGSSDEIRDYYMKGNGKVLADMAKWGKYKCYESLMLSAGHRLYSAGLNDIRWNDSKKGFVMYYDNK